jgi:hypothetical protein
MDSPFEPAEGVPELHRDEDDNDDPADMDAGANADGLPSGNRDTTEADDMPGQHTDDSTDHSDQTPDTPGRSGGPSKPHDGPGGHVYVMDDGDDDDSGPDFESPLAEETGDWRPSYLPSSDSGHTRHGLKDPEATVLRTIVDAYNQHKEYPLELPMNQHITNTFNDVSVKSLEERGFLERHNIGKRGAWYTVTSKGQQAVGRTCKAGAWKGDRGEAMPHRVGTYLLRMYFEQLPNVHRAAVYEPVGDEGERIDAVGYNADGAIIHAGEIEAGEKSVNGNTKNWGINNGKSIAHDYEKLASLPGDSWWICRNRMVADRVMNWLKNKGCLDIDNVPSGPTGRKRSQINQLDADGIDHLYALNELWEALEEGVFLHE